MWKQQVTVMALIDLLGREWFLREQRKAPASRHPVARWVQAYDAAVRHPPAGSTLLPGGGHSFEPDGAVQSLLCLARDVDRVSDMPKALARRLRSAAGFQAARYELAVASIFIAAGFDLEWQRSKTARHVEFFACGRDGARIAVEAKSRVRGGVLGAREGAPADVEEVGIRKLFKRALQQLPPDMPGAVFVDVNLPIRRRDYVRKGMWRVELKRLVDELEREGTEADPHDYSLFFATNFAWYFDEAGLAQPEAAEFTIPNWSRHPIAVPTAMRILDAVNRYPSVEN